MDQSTANKQEEIEVTEELKPAKVARPTEIKTPSDQCPSCLKKLQKYEMGYFDEYEIFSCQNCGSVFLDPPISRGTIDKFYSDLDPEVIHIANHIRRVKDLSKTLLKICDNPKEKTILNVNCMQGYAVAAAKEAGFKEIKGIERYDFYVDFAKKNYGKDYFEAVTVEEYIEREEQHDVVVSIESFCMQTDVDKHLETISKTVKLGGLLYIEEIDGNSHFLPNDLTRWAYMEPPITTNFISEKALRILLEKHGFKIKKKFFNWGVMLKLVAVKVK